MSDRISDEPLIDCVDGMVWAKEFNKRFPSVAVDDALGWFCSAIENGKNFEHRKAEQSRALVSQMRQLAGAMQDSSSAMAQYFGRQLDSLLSAHGGA